jgi:hypothetical protein
MKGGEIIGVPEVDLDPLLQQVPDHLRMASLGSRHERCAPSVDIQQPPVLLHEALHLREVAVIGREDQKNGAGVHHLEDLKATVEIDAMSSSLSGPTALCCGGASRWWPCHELDSGLLIHGLVDEDEDNNHGLPYAIRKEAIRVALRGNLEERRRQLERPWRLLEIDDGECTPLRAAADHGYREMLVRGPGQPAGPEWSHRPAPGLLQHGPSQ